MLVRTKSKNSLEPVIWLSLLHSVIPIYFLTILRKVVVCFHLLLSFCSLLIFKYYIDSVFTWKVLLQNQISLKWYEVFLYVLRLHDMFRRKMAIHLMKILLIRHVKVNLIVYLILFMSKHSYEKGIGKCSQEAVSTQLVFKSEINLYFHTH